MSEESSAAEQLALALKKNEMLLEKINMLKSAYASKSDELQSDRTKLTAALAKVHTRTLPLPSPSPSPHCVL